MIHPERAHTRLVEQIEPGERGGSDIDRDLSLAFDDRTALLPSQYSPDRREKLRRHCTIVSEVDGNHLATALEDREGAETIVR